MIVSVRVVPRSSRLKVMESGDGLKVYLTRPAEDGEANAQLIKVLAGHFGARLYQVTIIKGQTARNKLVEIVRDDE